MQSQCHWGSPAAGLCSQGGSLAKLKHQRDTLVFSPLVSAEMYTSQAHVPWPWGWQLCCLWSKLGAPESLLRLGSPGLMVQPPSGGHAVISLRLSHFPGTLWSSRTRVPPMPGTPTFVLLSAWSTSSRSSRLLKGQENCWPGESTFSAKHLNSAAHLCHWSAMWVQDLPHVIVVMVEGLQGDSWQQLITETP